MESLDLEEFKAELSMSDIHLLPEPRHGAPWYNSTERDAKRMRRKPERRWRKTRSEPEKEAYRFQCQVVRDKLVKPSQNTIITNYLRVTAIRMFTRLQTVYCLVQNCKNFLPMTQCKTFLSSLQTILFRRL